MAIMHTSSSLPNNMGRGGYRTTLGVLDTDVDAQLRCDLDESVERKFRDLASVQGGHTGLRQAKVPRGDGLRQLAPSIRSRIARIIAARGRRTVQPNLKPGLVASSGRIKTCRP